MLSLTPSLSHPHRFSLPPDLSLTLSHCSLPTRQFAIVDEAYPYISKRLLTDESPRLRAALRYMVYGKGEVFDVDRMIDLLQALEKFVAVRDTGDGSAFKVDGMRGATEVGAAGDTIGSKALAPTSRASSTADADDAAEAAEKARVALQFFFSSEGEIFRGFLLDEVVRAADALSREALTQLLVSPALSRLPALPLSKQLFSALAPPLTPNDQKVVDGIRRLTSFFFGEIDDGGLRSDAAATTSSGNGFGLNSPSIDQASVRRARALLPVVQENQAEMRNFALQIVGRLTELQTSRGLGWVRDRVAVL